MIVGRFQDRARWACAFCESVVTGFNGPSPDFQNKVVVMSAFGWIAFGHRLSFASFLRRRKSRPHTAKRSLSVTPRLESMEKIELLSVAAHPFLQARAAKPTIEVLPFSSTWHQVSKQATSSSQVVNTQVVSVPDTLTNFDLQFAPTIQKFNPSLGQLVDVKVTATSTLTSIIQSHNTSTTTGADITGFTNGSFTIFGLPSAFNGTLNGKTATVSVTADPGGTAPDDFNLPSAVTFPPLTTSKTQTFTYTSPSDLAYFTASGANTTLSTNLVMQATSSANAPNGNLFTFARTFGSGQITVTYDYLAECPPVTNLVRYGLHHQPTQLKVTFGGPLNPADANNPIYYKIIVPNAHGSFTGPGTRVIPIAYANYDPTTSTVSLVPVAKLNVHRQYQLLISLPCTNGMPQIVQFGGKRTLAGYLNHQGVPVVYTGGRLPGQK